MFPQHLYAEAQASMHQRLRDSWLAHPPRTGAGWGDLIAEADADHKVVLELHCETGFSSFHCDLPPDPVIYIVLPEIEVSGLLGHYHTVTPYWVLD